MNLDFNVDASRQFEALQAVDRLGVWVDNVDQTLVNSHLKMLLRIFVNVRATNDGETMFVGRQRDWPPHGRTRSSDGFDNLLGGIVNILVIKRL